MAKKVELAIRPDMSSLGMVAVYPSAEEAAAIAPAGGNPAETIHVTMVFLGDVAEIDMKAAARAVGSVSGSTAPLSGMVGGVGLFAAGEDGFPQLAIPNVVGLAKLRADLVAALADEGIVSPSEHDWVPHSTLAYVEEPSLPDLSVIGLPLTFDQLSLVEADVRKDFPFDPEGSSDDVHRADGNHAVYSRSEQRRRDILFNKAKEGIA
jgi:2'-5' RNA ligase